MTIPENNAQDGATDPTTPLELPGQAPSASSASSASARGSHTRTILEVVGAVVAVFLILLAGVGGFLAGALTVHERGDRDFGRAFAESQMTDGARDFGRERADSDGGSGGREHHRDADGHGPMDDLPEPMPSITPPLPSPAG